LYLIIYIKKLNTKEVSEFDEINSMKFGSGRTEKFIQYYTDKVKIEDWLVNPFKNSIINYKNRTEYKKNNQYHRLNGPAIDYNDEKLDEYYYKGKKFETKEEWKKASIKELRKIKIKKVNIENEKSSD
jgi:hypothetical protein